MLPIKIKEFLNDLHLKTEKGQIKWVYSDIVDKVTFATTELEISIAYMFDETEEIGRYKVRISKNGKEYWYSTSQLHSDFEDVRKLYDSAQSSDLELGPSLKL